MSDQRTRRRLLDSTLDCICESLRSLDYRAAIANRREQSPYRAIVYMRPDTELLGRDLRNSGTVRLLFYSRPYDIEPGRPWIYRFKVDVETTVMNIATRAARVILAEGKQLYDTITREPSTGQAELNCVPDELEAFAKWLPHWILARDAQLIRELRDRKAPLPDDDDEPPYAREELPPNVGNHPAAKATAQEIAPPYELATRCDSMTIGTLPLRSTYYSWSAAAHRSYFDHVYRRRAS